MRPTDDTPPTPPSNRNEFQDQIDRKSTRMVKSRRVGDRSVWFGLGTMGLVGWSVAIPTLIGIAIGLWIDTRFPSPYSWTLMLLFVGVVVGCFNAWYWVQRENQNE